MNISKKLLAIVISLFVLQFIQPVSCKVLSSELVNGDFESWSGDPTDWINIGFNPYLVPVSESPYGGIMCACPVDSGSTGIIYQYIGSVSAGESITLTLAMGLGIDFIVDLYVGTTGYTRHTISSASWNLYSHTEVFSSSDANVEVSIRISYTGTVTSNLYIDAASVSGTGIAEFPSPMIFIIPSTILMIMVTINRKKR